jgi:hypothetical protein
MPVDLKKKYGPLSALGWAGVVGGLGVVYYLYRRYQADEAANAAAASAATPAGVGSTVPGSEAVTGSEGASPVWSSLEQWEGAAIAAMTAAVPGYSSAAAFNDVTDWINGSCVSSQGYSAISAAISNSTVGLPPGVNAPPLTVCSTATSGSSASGTYTPPAGEALVGPGYEVPNSTAAIQDSTGNWFSPILNATQANALLTAGEQLFYQPQPGQFVALAPGQSYAGFPVYSKLPYAPAPNASTTATTSS